MRVKKLLAVFALVPLIGAAGTPDKVRNFIACPILQDTKTVPCWMADFQGKRYFVVIQTDAAGALYPPYLGHKALVEGTVSDKPNVCGGIVLDPVKVSVLPDLDANCQTILPDVGYDVTAMAPRGPGPRAKISELRERGFRNALPPTPAAAAAEPTGPQTFTLYYDFNAPQAGRSVREFGQAINYAKKINAASVEITTYRAGVQLTDGAVATEEAWLPRTRLDLVKETIVKAGVPEKSLKLKWVEKPESGNGVQDWKLRRTVIVVSP